MRKTIITVIGYDQPGIIAAVSDVLADQGCNIENISQTILQSQFAGIFIALIPEALSAEDLEAKFSDKFTGKAINIHVNILQEDPAPAEEITADRFILSTTGPDKQGLVAGISEAIASFGVNIANLTAIFQGGDNPDKNFMIYEIDIPETVDHSEFSERLRKKAETLGLDLTLQHKNIFDMVNRI